LEVFYLIFVLNKTINITILQTFYSVTSNFRQNFFAKINNCRRSFIPTDALVSDPEF